MACLKLVCVIVLCMVVVAPIASEATVRSCLQVGLAVAPCSDYLKNGGDAPKECCDSLTKLNNNADSTESRRKSCECIKKAVSKANGAVADHAASLPQKCNIKLPFKISPSMECTSVQ